MHTLLIHLISLCTGVQSQILHGSKLLIEPAEPHIGSIRRGKRMFCKNNDDSCRKYNHRMSKYYIQLALFTGPTCVLQKAISLPPHAAADTRRRKCLLWVSHSRIGEHFWRMFSLSRGKVMLLWHFCLLHEARKKKHDYYYMVGTWKALLPCLLSANLVGRIHGASSIADWCTNVFLILQPSRAMRRCLESAQRI